MHNWWPGGKRRMSQLDRIKTCMQFQFYAPLRLNRFPSYYLSCSQFGEDMIIRHLLADVRTGFYVDIGAHHPVYYSNTYHFYCSGWRGINVDALPGSMEVFNLLRPRDINVEACVDAVPGRTLEFFLFDSPALNTVSRKDADRVIQASAGHLAASQTLSTTTLDELLDRHLPPGQRIDFLTIDVEGLDEVILRSHDFARHHPRVLVFERKEGIPTDLGRDPLVAHLRTNGYDLVAFTGASLVMQFGRPS